MLLGHGAIGQFGVAEALSGLVVNAGTVDVSMGQAATASAGTLGMTGSAVFAVTTAGVGTFSLGTEVATGGATVSPATAGSITASVGEKQRLESIFQNFNFIFCRITRNFFLWNEVDDCCKVQHGNVDPGINRT